MTPRALFTAIGATALAFALAIGVAAERTTMLPTESPPRTFAAAETLPAIDQAHARLAAWNDPRAIAV